MTSEDLLWDLEPATAAKHRLYQRYLDAWWPILLQTSAKSWSWPRVTYLDAFAGPGVYKGGEPGSPMFTLDRLLNHGSRARMNLSRGRVALAFIERDPRRHDRLHTELVSAFGALDGLPVTVRTRCGDAATDTLDVLDEAQAWGTPLLAVFDSWGNVNVPLSTMAQIAANPSSEVIVTFGPNWFSRREEQDPAQLDDVFGGRDYWLPSDAEARPDERWRAWLETYQDALRRAGFTYTLQFEIRPRTGQPLYLVYGTSHPKGLIAMKDAMWDVDAIDGQSFRDPRLRDGTAIGQLSLFGEAFQHPELLSLVQLRLREGHTTVEDLRDWLLRETARWRERDAIPAVTALRDEGLVRVTPPGRITRESRVELIGFIEVAR